jgi:hypothetical protein
VLQDVTSQAGTNSSINIPIKLESTEAKYNSGIRRRLWGYPTSKSKITVTDYILSPTSGNPEIDMFETVDINGERTGFGILGIMESMAKCLQRSMFDYKGGSPEYPYHICEKVISLVYQNFGNDPVNVFALCDASLMYSNPPSVFLLALKTMKEENYQISCMHDVYKFVFSRFKHADSPNSFLLPYHENYIATVNYLTAIFGKDDSMKAEKEWILYRLNTAYNMRNNNPAFWINILSGFSPEQRRENLSHLYNTIGFPIIFDNDWDMLVQDIKQTDLDVNYAIFPAFKAILGVLANGKKECYLHEYCKIDQVLSSIYDVHCKQSPWEKAVLQEKCPFSLLWNRLGFAGKSVHF